MSTKMVFLAFAILLAIGSASANVDSLLKSVPVLAEEFKQTEKAFINTVNWLENTPLNTRVKEREALVAYLIAWMAGTPDFGISVQESVIPFATANPPLMIVFMGGWARYSIENEYSSDSIKCTAAGIRSVIRVYLKDEEYKRDPRMDELVKLEKDGELEKWIATQYGK